MYYTESEMGNSGEKAPSLRRRKGGLLVRPVESDFRPMKVVQDRRVYVTEETVAQGTGRCEKKIRPLMIRGNPSLGL